MSEQLREILKLSVPERILLVEAIWDSIAEDNKVVELSEDQKTLINLRLEQYRNNSKTLLSWEEVKS